MDRTRSRCDTISHVKCPPQCPLPELPFGFAKPLHCRGKLDDRCVGIFWVGIALQREKKDPLAKRPRKKRVCFVINSRLNCIQLRSGDDFQINVLEVWWRLCSHSERRYRLSEVIHSRLGQRSGNSLQFRVNIICVNRPEAGASPSTSLLATSASDRLSSWLNDTFFRMEAQCRYGERRGSPTAAGDGRWLRIHRPKNPGASTLKRGAAVRVNPFVRCFYFENLFKPSCGFLRLCRSTQILI
jgi:hypothetical protein